MKFSFKRDYGFVTYDDKEVPSTFKELISHFFGVLFLVCLIGAILYFGLRFLGFVVNLFY